MNTNKKEFSRRLMPGLFIGRNTDGWLMLVRLPLGYGLNLGTGFSGFVSIRYWELARLDYADHFCLLFGTLTERLERLER